VNDQSLHGQFHEAASFREAVGAVMRIKATLQRFGRSLHCHRNLLHAQLGPELNLQSAVQTLSMEERSALMQWLTRHGPFWEDLRMHGADDYLEYQGEIVTDTAIGEAAFAVLNGLARHLVSFTPSNFCFSPVPVECVADSVRSTTQVENHWDAGPLEGFLRGAPPPISSWSDLEAVSRARFNSLTLCDRAFEPLVGHPFVQSAATRLVVVLEILDRFHQCFDAEGKRTSEGDEIYQQFFTGKKGGGGRGAMFSDSSGSEKAEFAAELKFPHPESAGESLVCPWHGKVQTPPYRVHFSYPIRAEQSLYVVYVGPKITRR